LSYGYYYSGGARRKISKEEIKRRNATRRANRIRKHFEKFKDLYEYNSIEIDADAARSRGLNFYWSICKNGHIGEFDLNHRCRSCQRINRSIRDAHIRGAATVKLTKKEKEQVYEIYQIAKKMTSETGVEHHVDHIRPLAAGGEHHPSNLQVIPATENLKKGSKFDGRLRKYKRREKKEKSSEMIEKQKDKLYDVQLEAYRKKTFILRLFTKKPKRLL